MKCPTIFKFRRYERAGSGSSEDVHPFGGCDRLLGQYRILGSELLRLEGLRDICSGAIKAEDFELFRQSLIFIPVEVLRSYRDDLLNPEIPSARLFIGTDAQEWKLPLLSLGGIGGALVLGLYAASVGAPFFISLAITVVLAAPFVSILHFLPREGVFRRLRFAKWLSEEISFRDGSGGSRIGRRRTTGLLSPGWISQVSSAGASCQEIPPVRIESHDLKRNPWEFLN